MSENLDKFCFNCNHALAGDEKYCPRCSQKTDAHILTIGELITNFFDAILNWDNSIIHTLKYIWAPWKLTQFYVEGKRKSFLNPMRLFLFCMVIHFGYMASLTDSNYESTINEIHEVHKSTLYKQFIELRSKANLDDRSCIFADTIETTLFHSAILPEKDTFMLFNGVSILDYNMTRKDALELPIDSLYKKYKITGFFNKLIVKQAIHISLDKEGMLKYGISNAPWGILLAIVLLSAFFKLLYYRKKKLIVEHIVFWLNVHSFLFLLVTVLAIFADITESSYITGMVTFIIVCTLPAFLFLSLYKNYKQGLLKTSIKFMITGFLYIVLVFMFGLSVGIGSLAFF